MKKHMVIMIAFAFAVLAAANAFGGEMTAPMSKESLIGSEVQNMEGKKLGKISDVSADDAGRIRFAILSHGGIIGMGEKLIAIPMRAISFKEEKLAVVDISEEKLNTAPSFTKDNRPDMTNRTWVEETSRFYGVRPYWDESETEQKMKETEDIQEEEYEHKDAPAY